jgi:hypothetical protein
MGGWFFNDYDLPREIVRSVVKAVMFNNDIFTRELFIGLTLYFNKQRVHHNVGVRVRAFIFYDDKTLNIHQ